MAVLVVTETTGAPLTVAGTCSATPGKVRRVELSGVVGPFDLVLAAGDDAVAVEFGDIADEGDKTSAAMTIPGGAAAPLARGVGVLCVSSTASAAEFRLFLRRP